MNLPLQDLNGPQRDSAEQIIRCALAMDEQDARRLSQAWENSPAGVDHLAYLTNCKAIWDALEESGRFLPLGWFEAIFVDCAWVDTTRALHAVADAVCATLVRDIIPETTFQYMLQPWNAEMTVSVK